MLKIFIIYCTALIVLLAVANQNGYVYTSVLDSYQKVNKAANHYHK